MQFAKRQLLVNPYESTAVADLNKDGHLDIVYGAYWFAGPDWVIRTFRPNHLAAEYIRANSDHVLDVDGDSWPDIVAGGWDEDGIYWYRNPGNSAKEKGAPWEHAQALGGEAAGQDTREHGDVRSCTTSTATASPSCTPPATASSTRWRSGASARARTASPT